MKWKIILCWLGLVGIVVGVILIKRPNQSFWDDPPQPDWFKDVPLKKDTVINGKKYFQKN